MGSTSNHKIWRAEMFGKFLLAEATTRQAMDQIMDVVWAANNDPYEPWTQIFFTVHGFSTADRDATITEVKERFWSEYNKELSHRWFYVQDTETGNFVACMQWEVEEHNPFPEGPPKLTTPWWPDGEYREFTECIVNQLYACRAHWMTRKHIALNWMSVIPGYRRYGIGSFLMNSLINFADDPTNPYECWLEGTSMAKPMYEKFGFNSLFKIAFDTDKKNPSDVWRRCEHELTPAPIYAMWRPKNGEGEKVTGALGERLKMPWHLGSD